MTSHNNNLDLANMMIKIQQQLAALDQKVDHYFKNALPKPVTNLPSPQNAQPSQPSSPRPAVAQAMATGNSRPANQHQRPGRTIFKATCAECQKECEIPFKPTGGRPVYCKE